MALSDLIAQRLANAARQRAALQDPGQIPAALSQLANFRQNEEALALRKQAMDQQAKQFEAEQEATRVPDFIARPVAESALPEPTLESIGAPSGPYVGPSYVDELESRKAERSGQIDRIVSALGARGGANLLAKLTAYSAMEQQRHAAALKAVQEAKALDAYLRVRKGGVDAVQPGDPLGPVQSADIRFQADQPKAEEDTRPQVRAMIEAAKARGEDTTGLSEDMDPVTVRDFLREGRIGGRFETRMEFSREKYADFLERDRQEEAKKDQIRQENLQAKTEQERQQSVSRYLGTLDRQIQDVQSALRANVMFSDDLRGNPVRTVINENRHRILEQRLKTLEDERDIWAKKQAEFAEGPPGEDRRAIIREKIKAGTSTPEEEAEFETLIRGK